MEEGVKQKIELKGDVHIEGYDESKNTKENMQDEAINISKLMSKFIHFISVHVFGI